MAFDSYAAGTLLILASGLAAVLGLLVVRKTYNVQTLVTAHDVSGQYLSIVGTMYAVLLGLIVVDAMARFQQAVVTVEEEANSLSELIFLSGRMPPAVRSQVQQKAAEYAQIVIDARMAHNEGRAALARSPGGRHRVDAQSFAIGSPFPKAKSRPTAWLCPPRHRSGTDDANASLYVQRTIPSLEWCIVILGGMVTVGLTYVFVFDDLRDPNRPDDDGGSLDRAQHIPHPDVRLPVFGRPRREPRELSPALDTEAMGSPL